MKMARKTALRIGATTDQLTLEDDVRGVGVSVDGGAIVGGDEVADAPVTVNSPVSPLTSTR